MLIICVYFREIFVMDSVVDDEAFCEAALHAIHAADAESTHKLVDDIVASSLRISPRELLRSSSNLLKTRAYELGASSASLLVRLLCSGLLRWEASPKPPRALVYDDALSSLCTAAVICSASTRAVSSSHQHARELLRHATDAAAAACASPQFAAVGGMAAHPHAASSSSSALIQLVTGMCLVAACGAAHIEALAPKPAVEQAAACMALLPDAVRLSRALLVAVCDGTRSLWRAGTPAAGQSEIGGGNGDEAGGSLHVAPPQPTALRADEPSDPSVEASFVAFAFACESPVCGDAEEDEDEGHYEHSGSGSAGRSLLPHSCLPAARVRVGDSSDRVRRFLQDLWPALLRAPCTGGCSGITHGLRLAASRAVITAHAAAYGLSPTERQTSTGAASTTPSASASPVVSHMWPVGTLRPGEELRLLATPAAILLLHVAAAAMRGGMASETLVADDRGRADEADHDDDDADGHAHRASAGAGPGSGSGSGSIHARSGFEAAELAIASLMRCVKAMKAMKALALPAAKSRGAGADRTSSSTGPQDGLAFLLPAAYGRLLDAATPAVDASVSASASASAPPSLATLDPAGAGSVGSSSHLIIPSCVASARAAASLTEPPGDLALLQALLLLSAHSPDARLRGRAYAAFSALLASYADAPRFRLIAMLLVPPQSPREAAKLKASMAVAAAVASASVTGGSSGSDGASTAVGTSATGAVSLLVVTMTRHVAAAESVSGAINSSIQLRGAVLDALRSAVAAAAGRWIASSTAAAATVTGAAPASGTASREAAGAAPDLPQNSPLLGSEAVDLLREVIEARAGMGISQRPWVHALAAAAAARSGATGSSAASSATLATLDLPATAGDTAAEAAALVEQSDIDMSLLSTVRLLLMQAQKASAAAALHLGTVTFVTAAADGGAGADDAYAPKRPRLSAPEGRHDDAAADSNLEPAAASLPVLPPVLAAFAPSGSLTARLRDAYVRPLAAAVRAVQEHFRRQVGATVLAPHREPVPPFPLAAMPSNQHHDDANADAGARGDIGAAATAGSTRSTAAPRGGAAASSMTAVSPATVPTPAPAPAPAPQAEVAAEHRDEDTALLSRLALLDAAIDPVMALLP